MRFLSVLFTLAVLCGAVSATATATATATAAPLSAYGGLPNIDSIEISPDGSTLAMIVSDGENRGLVVRPAAGGPSKAYSVGAAKVRSLDWVGADHLIITTSQTDRPTGLIGPKHEYFLGFALDVKAQKVESLFEKSLAQQQTGTHFRGPATQISNSLNVLAGPPEVRTIDGKPTLFLQTITFKDRYGVLTVVRADLKNGRRDIVDFGSPDTRGVLLGQDGRVVARSDYDAQTGQWSLKARSGGGWAETRAAEAKLDRPYMVGLGRDGQAILIAEMGSERIPPARDLPRRRGRRTARCARRRRRDLRPGDAAGHRLLRPDG
jgi:hypothetical protein